MTTTYLCGPINGCTDEEASDWRELAKRLLRGKTIDPMRRDYRGLEGEPNMAKEIVELDKIDVTNSDVVLVSYTKPSVGTSMEVLYAWERGKLVVIVSKYNDWLNLSPWLMYHSHRQFFTYRDACDFINGLS